MKPYGPSWSLMEPYGAEEGPWALRKLLRRGLLLGGSSQESSQGASLEALRKRLFKRFFEVLLKGLLKAF